MASRIPRDRNVRLRYRRIKAFKCLCAPCSRNLYPLHVLKLLLGTCRSVGPRPAPRSLSVTGLETFRSTGPKAGPRSHLLRVLKLPLGTFRSTGPRPALRSLSVTGLETAVVHLSFHWAQGIYICYRSWNCCWALVVPLGPRNLYLLQVLKLLLGTCRSTGPKAGPKESKSAIQVLKLPLDTFRSTGHRHILFSGVWNCRSHPLVPHGLTCPAS